MRLFPFQRKNPIENNNGPFVLVEEKRICNFVLQRLNNLVYDCKSSNWTSTSISIHKSLNFMGTIQAIGKDSCSSFLHSYYTHHCINHLCCNSLEKLSHTKLMIHKHFQINISLSLHIPMSANLQTYCFIPCLYLN